MFLRKSLKFSVKNKFVFVRCASISHNINTKLLDDSRVPKSWNTIVNEAEKVVGYPTSFLNLRWLLSDEFANIGMHIKKLLGTGHPILDTARNLLVQSHAPSWGLVILLVSKAGGLHKDFPEVDKDQAAGILHSQRVLAEVAEMIRTSNKIHKSLHHVYDLTPFKEDMFYGNKIALLCGDYLLSTSFKELANIGCHELNEQISKCLRDYVENEFIGLRDKQNKPIPTKRIKGEHAILDLQDDLQELKNLKINAKKILGNTKAEWTLRSMLGGGSLLADSCSCSLILSKHPKNIQDNGYLVGKHIALAWQSQLDLEPFIQKHDGIFSLVSAPVLFHLDYNPELYSEIERGFDSVDNINYIYLKKKILNGPAVDKTKKLQEYHVKKALEYIELMPNTQSRTALKNLVTPLL